MSNATNRLLVFLALATAIGGAFVGFRALNRLLSHDPGRSRKRSVFDFLLALLAAPTVLILLLFAVCWGPKPGESDQAIETKNGAAPVIEALQRYKAARGLYPNTLADISPSLLSPEKMPRGGINVPYDITYRLDAIEGYVLDFQYSGPGMNRCEYTARAKAWRCFGYF